jgi:hypothetical protein
MPIGGCVAVAAALVGGEQGWGGAEGYESPPSSSPLETAEAGQQFCQIALERAVRVPLPPPWLESKIVIKK